MIELDEALERFQMGQLEYGGGLANHGPMAAEALLALGHGALVTGWIDRYAPRLLPLAPGKPLPEDEWESALANPDRGADWVATFEAQLEQAPWEDVLRRGIARLEAGLFAGAAHGWLRVAHAVRALERSDTPVRRRELAFGFAYWAARYQVLPGEPGSAAQSGRDAGEALLAVQPVPADERQPGFFFDAVRVLDGRADFAAAVARFDPSAADEVSASIGSLCRAAARLYLANPTQRIAYVHAVTAPSALRLVARHVEEPVQRVALGRAFQAAAALHAVSGDPAGPNEPGEVDAEVRALAESPDEIRYRAACALDEHAIKMAEACLREDALAPDPVLRLAAADAALRLPAPGSARC